MMRNIADYIEHYLKSLLEQTEDGAITVQRNELAEMFACVPSQINYVLNTRFTLERGYLVESRRGGGGFIRIKKISLNPGSELLRIIRDGIGETIDQETASGYIMRLLEGEFISPREASLLLAAVQREHLSLPLPLRDMVRASILKAMLFALLRHQ